MNFLILFETIWNSLELFFLILTLYWFFNVFLIFILKVIQSLIVPCNWVSLMNQNYIRRGRKWRIRERGERGKDENYIVSLRWEIKLETKKFCIHSNFHAIMMKIVKISFLILWWFPCISFSYLPLSLPSSPYFLILLFLCFFFLE